LVENESKEGDEMAIQVLLTAGLGVLLYSSTARAQIAPAQQKLEGVWVASVTRLNPPPNVPPTFHSLHTYTAGGGYVETSSTGRTTRSPGFGEWLRTGDRQFTITQYFFRFGPNEQFAGITRLIRNIRLSENGNEFQGVSMQDQFDPDGKLIVSGLKAIESGRRLDNGEMAEKP
jgi:hypothetical protein